VSTLNVNRIADASGGVFAPVSSVHKNRIINGAMVIDQRNAGASSTPSTGAYYSLDRWRGYYSQTGKFTVQQNAGSVTPPVGFSNYLGVTSSSAYSVLSGDYFTVTQLIEGFNTADLQWGTANAKTVTLSFWVRSSLTGTFGGSLSNSGETYSYPFSYTISAANTWEQKTVTIAGPTSGTWIGATNGIGIELNFGIGVGSSNSGTAGSWASAGYISATGATSVVGTNGATFYITGVQLEVGTQATSFEYRQYGTELNLCQRYYNPNVYGSTGFAYSSTTGVLNFYLGVSMRTTPTVVFTSGTSTSIDFIGGTQSGITLGASGYTSPNTLLVTVGGMSGRTTWQGIILAGNNNVALTAEL
jgi:hypothetical protein